jgi:hypothetical protein
MASISNMLANVQQDKKPAYRPLLLDASGKVAVTQISSFSFLMIFVNVMPMTDQLVDFVG